MHFAALESRRLLSASVNLTDDGMLRIQGSDGHDDVRFLPNIEYRKGANRIIKSEVIVYLDDVRYSFSTDEVKSIRIALGDGDDMASVGKLQRLTKKHDVVKPILAGWPVTISGGAGRDELFGSYGDDTLDGGDGPDVLDGSFGDDSVDGGAGNDLFQEQGGHDRLDGGAGDDIFLPRAKPSRDGTPVEIHGGGGRDYVHSDGGIKTRVYSVETLDRHKQGSGAMFDDDNGWQLAN